MITYCASNQGTMFGYLCGRYPGLVGNLFSPGSSCTVWPFAPYALDNGAFVAWSKQQQWNETVWLKFLDNATKKPYPPMWGLVPDVVTDRDRTLEMWEKYSPLVRAAGFKAAFAVQDGMQIGDVPCNADLVFVGGSTQWKWQTMEMWCEAFPRVHVGRVNSYGKLLRCFKAGAESTDGTGWFIGRGREVLSLMDFLEFISGRGQRAEQRKLFDSGDAFRPADRMAQSVREVAYYRPRNENRTNKEAQQVKPSLWE